MVAKGGRLQKAFFLYQHGLLYAYRFNALIYALFNRSAMTVTCKLYSNLNKIANIINQINDNDKQPIGPYRVFDMLQAKIEVRSAPEMLEAYYLIKGEKNLEIVRIENNLNAPL